MADDEALIEALNSVLLPPRFTGIWHRDTKDFEVIWAAIPDNWPELSRTFDFRFGIGVYRCEYATPSKRLIAIADAVRQTSRPPSEYTRLFNLISLKSIERVISEAESLRLVPTSFWIRNVEWDEGKIVELVRNLNFYMHYYDHGTPQILVHDPRPIASRTQPPRYPFDEFPAAIQGRALDPYLLSLWQSSMEGDTRLRFLYLYQILEYASFYWVRDTTQQSIRRILAAPETYTSPNQAVRQMLDVLAEEKSTDEQKIDLAVKQLVDPVAVWKEVEPNLAFFSSEIQFDGGFTLAAQFSASLKLSEFCSDWRSGNRFPLALRRIRNALVHGRESRMANVIAPTLANDDRLFPWLAPLSAAATRIVLTLEL